MLDNSSPYKLWFSGQYSQKMQGPIYIYIFCLLCWIWIRQIILDEYKRDQMYTLLILLYVKAFCEAGWLRPGWMIETSCNDMEQCFQEMLFWLLFSCGFNYLFALGMQKCRTRCCSHIHWEANHSIMLKQTGKPFLREDNPFVWSFIMFIAILLVWCRLGVLVIYASMRLEPVGTSWTNNQLG